MINITDIRPSLRVEEKLGAAVMIFANREDAAHRLAEQLKEFAGRNDVIVLGIPRGGVPIASEIADQLNAPLDIFLSRKLSVPGHEELAFGAIAAEDGRYLDQEIIRAAMISRQQIERVTAQVKEELNRRAALYRGSRPSLNVAGRIVILVDDGIATGASVSAAINALRQMKPAMLVLAVPVMPSSTYAWLQHKVDLLVCLYAPDDFYAVGQFYADFSQVKDDEVIALLHKAKRAPVEARSPSVFTERSVREVSINSGDSILTGTLTIPRNARGLVLFAHGSGSSRNSPRNRYVAEVLQSRGIATLLFDLLTHEEESIDQRTSQYRFDIDFLADRLIGATRWVRRQVDISDLPIGYFGASTGAAAALVAAAKLPDIAVSVVSRGGRPDLAGEYLPKVRASVLLLVGSKDNIVLRLNRQAQQELQCSKKELVIVPGASHLFEEAGTLEKVAHAAANWFELALNVAATSSSPSLTHTAGV